MDFKTVLMDARGEHVIIVRPFWGRQSDSMMGLLSYFDVKDLFQVDAGSVFVFGVEDVERIENIDTPNMIVRLKGPPRSSVSVL